uniref:Uncharacterized protein n=1 Tax=Chaetoceros debilis TaxID=122233 RepID=A0A7S3V8D7_9STRA|mmetsp:Transcript_19326/g.28510  ORF Transcript_19326/g.28510 Transcript_19326/m.28510 type:complete len:450 (+) Transcript_19326:123-1472(+)
MNTLKRGTLTPFAASLSVLALQLVVAAASLQQQITSDTNQNTYSLSAGAGVLEEDEFTFTFPSRRAEGDSHDGSKPWGAVIGFSLVINLATLSGVLFFIPLVSKKAMAWVKSCFFKDAVPDPNKAAEEENKEESTGGIPDHAHPDHSEDKAHMLDIIIPSFAAGALIATAVFLVIPEAIFLIQKFLNEKAESEEDHDDHEGHDHVLRSLEGEEEDAHDEHAGELTPDAIWRFGSSLIGGFMLPLVFAAFSPRKRGGHYDDDSCDDDNNISANEQAFKDDEEGGEVAPTPTREIDYGLTLSILLGDALHNFCDGVFVGIALLQCDKSVAYTIVGITLYHEIAQELADYFLLTKHAGLTPLVALVWNFLSGLSILLGGLVVLAAPISDMLVGVILSLAAGVYLYIAACECLPRVNEVTKGTARKDKFITMLAFVVGVVPIGLALLNHEHCD